MPLWLNVQGGFARTVHEEWHRVRGRECSPFVAEETRDRVNRVQALRV